MSEPDADRLIARLERASSCRSGDPILLKAAAEIRCLRGLVHQMSALVTGMADYAMHVMPAQHGTAVCDDYARATAIAATLSRLEPQIEGEGK